MSQLPPSRSSSEAFFSREAIASVPWLVGSKVLTFILYFVISVVIVRGLSPAEYGVYSLVISLAENLAVVCAFGLNVSLLRFVPELVRDKNRAGLVRLLTRSAGVEAVMWGVIALALYFFHGRITQLLHFQFIAYFWPTVALTGMFAAKDYLNNVFTALLRVRVVALMSAVQAALLLSCLWLLFPLSIKEVIISYVGSIAFVSLVSVGLLIFIFFRWRVKSPDRGIGRRRIFYLSFPTLGNAVTNKFLQQYSEIFFLGYFASAQVVGYYSLGYMLANLLLTFIPLALHTLFTSAFAEAYGKHRESLGRLMGGMYQILLFICLPLCLLGVFFAPQAVTVIYGGKMAAAGPIASFFCLFQALTLVWIPLSMALTATEKVAKTMWLNILQLAINLGLDYFLIKYYGVAGALMAVTLTFLVMAPVKFWVIGGLLGGIYFPWSFALRIGLPALFLAALFYFVLPPLGLLGLIIMSAAYLAVWILALKVLRLIRSEDTQRFRLVGLARLNRVIDFFIS